MLSERLADIVKGRRRAHPLMTLCIAISVTVAVVVPLADRVNELALGPVADAGQAVVMVDGRPAVPLADSSLSGTVLISYEDARATGVAFGLYRDGEAQPLLVSEDLEGPSFHPVTLDGEPAAFDTAQLDPGSYALFLTASTPGGEQRTAIPFTVAQR